MASPHAADHANKVRVVARTKPTAHFPHDIIDIDEDGRVRVTMLTQEVFKALPIPLFPLSYDVSPVTPPSQPLCDYASIIQNVHP